MTWENAEFSHQEACTRGGVPYDPPGEDSRQGAPSGTDREGVSWLPASSRSRRFSESVRARQMRVSHAAITAKRSARVAGQDWLGLIEQPLAGAQDDRCNHKVHLVD